MSLTFVALVVSVLALAVGMAALYPVVLQYYRDSFASWPFEVELHGLLQDVSPQLASFCFRISNLSSKPAFFQVGVVRAGPLPTTLADYVSLWPSTHHPEPKLFIEIPPLVWRNTRIRPFNLTDNPRPEEWSLVFTEYYHGRAAQVFAWPEHLDSPIDEHATEIPWGSTHQGARYIRVKPTRIPVSDSRGLRGW